MSEVSEFFKAELGASLVEYAVALIIVTIVGGTGVSLIGGSTGQLASNASVVVDDARTGAAATVVIN